MREPDNIAQVAELKPDYMGFIFYPESKRYVSDLDEGILNKIPAGIKKTGVFVNSSVEQLVSTINDYHLDAVQLHGSESPELCRNLKLEGVEVIKAFGLDPAFDFAVLEKYEDAADYFLFDTRTVAYGGSGITFDWKMLKNYSSEKPFFLSGGLSAENLKDIEHIDNKQLYAVDINSKFESEPGVKDIEKVRTAINYIRLKEK